MTSRRDVIRSLGIGTAAVVSATASVTAVVSPSLHAFTHAGATAGSPWWILAPLQVGSGIGKGWSIAALTGI